MSMSEEENLKRSLYEWFFKWDGRLEIDEKKQYYWVKDDKCGYKMSKVRVRKVNILAVTTICSEKKIQTKDCVSTLTWLARWASRTVNVSRLL